MKSNKFPIINDGKHHKNATNYYLEYLWCFLPTYIEMSNKHFQETVNMTLFI